MDQRRSRWIKGDQHDLWVGVRVVGVGRSVSTRSKQIRMDQRGLRQIKGHQCDLWVGFRVCVALRHIIQHIYIYIYILIGPGTSGVSTSSTLGLGTSLSSLPSSALYGYTDTDSDLELDEVESAKLKQKVEEASEHLAVELQKKEAYDTAANTGIDTTFLDPEQGIHMMSGRCLRSTPDQPQSQHPLK